HYPAEGRAHYVQTVEALGAWAGRAPLGDRELGHAAIDRLAAAARQTGLASDEDLREAGMEDSLRRLGPFLAAVKATTADYGLDLDQSLADLRTGLVQEDGDQATVLLHYPLGGREIETTPRLTPIQGHWYLDGYLEAAARVLAAATPAGGLPEPPAAPARPGGRSSPNASTEPAAFPGPPCRGS